MLLQARSRSSLLQDRAADGGLLDESDLPIPGIPEAWICERFVLPEQPCES